MHIAVLGVTWCRFVQWGIDCWCSLVQLTAHGTVCRLVKFGADRFRLVQFGVDWVQNSGDWQPLVQFGGHW